jgi:hypothetical protein
MDVSRIISGKQPRCKFCNTAWDPAQYPLCKAIQDKQQVGDTPSAAPAASAAPPANAGEATSLPKIGSGFIAPPAIPAELGWVTKSQVQTLHQVYHSDGDIQADPARWKLIKEHITGIKDDTKLGQLDFIIQQPPMAPKQAMHHSTVRLNEVRAKMHRNDNHRVSSKAAVDRYKLHIKETHAKLQAELEKLEALSIDADALHRQAAEEYEQAHAAWTKEMQEITSKAPHLSPEGEDETMEPSPEEQVFLDKMVDSLQANAKEIAKQMAQKSGAAPDAEASDVQMDEAAKRSIAESVQESYSLLRKQTAAGGPRAAKVARLTTAPEMAEGIQQQAEKAKKGL